MKLNKLTISNLLGARDVQLDLAGAPVHLICGDNGQGKTSIADGLRLALTADLSRVSLKKDAGALVTTGASAAQVSVTTADAEEYGVTITKAGKITDTMRGHDHDPRLPYVLNAQRIARMSDTDRRAFLFGVMGVETDHKAIVQRLIAKGADPKRVDRVGVMLRSGFDAAAKAAKDYASQARGAWKEVTGETFGAEKAKTWTAPVPEIDAEAERAVASDARECDAALDQAQQTVGALRAAEKSRADLRAKLTPLLEVAGRLERLERKLAIDEASLAEWEADLAKTKAAAGGGPRVGLVHDLAAAVHDALTSPHCAGYMESADAARAALQAYEREHGPVGATAGDAKARARLPSIQQSRDLLARSVANDRRDVDAARRAQAEAVAIEAELAKEFDAAALNAALDQVERLKARRADLQKRADALANARLAAASAERKAAQAAAHAADVAAWSTIADALLPDGIPAELLADALAPFNARLEQSAADTGWPRVIVHDDMRLTAGGRPYNLLSESEQWRADAMLAEAVSHLSGLGLLVLDRADILHPDARPTLISWLDVLADVGELSTALVFATLRAVPADLPRTFCGHWISAGRCAELAEAA